MAAAMLGKELVSLKVEEVRGALAEGEVILTFDTEQWTLTELKGDRAHFFDPNKANLPPGVEFTGGEFLPAHLYEEEGASAEMAVLEEWIRAGKARASRMV